MHCMMIIEMADSRYCRMDLIYYAMVISSLPLEENVRTATDGSQSQSVNPLLSANQ